MARQRRGIHLKSGERNWFEIEGVTAGTFRVMRFKEGFVQKVPQRRCLMVRVDEEQSSLRAASGFTNHGQQNARFGGESIEGDFHDQVEIQSGPFVQGEYTPFDQ